MAERRLVTVLFADLVGFTPYAEERDAEDVRETLSRYFELASDLVTRYGGTIEKFIGDAVMAVWGTPVAHEDDAERAVRAALDLVDAVPGLGAGIQARVGVLTGEAAVTLGAQNQGMVAGDLVNTASRLQSAAAPGVVLVGEATHRAAAKAIAFEPAGDQALKGKSAPVAAWRAIRVVAEVGGRGRADSLEAPFVGRDEELRLIKDMFHAMDRERKARLVSVIGPAGIGKSRLAWEFEKYLDGLIQQFWWHYGRSPAYGEGISFWALGEMVRGRAGLAETDDEATTRVRITESVARHVPDAEERAWIEPALLALLGVGELRPGGSEQLFAAWRTFFERLSQSQPVVMVFEDLHWADDGLLDFIDHLLEWSKAYPIFVLTLARPELLERRTDWGAGKRNFSSIYLEPLSSQAMRQLLSGLVPGLPEPAAAAIVARADGVPLYAIETVRMLVAEGRLVESESGYRPSGDLSTLAVPESLTALIAARLDGLDPADRTLVSDAAVLGQSFTRAAIAAVSGIAEAELEPLLRGLVRRELLTLEADPRSPERGQYGFVQALIREVAYNTLAKRDRKARHLAAARFFESLGTDELAGALAGQYVAAYRNSAEGPEAEALGGQARIALRAAADRAVGLGSYRQALAFLRQGLEVTPDSSDRAELLERAGDAAGAIGEHSEADALLREAISVYGELGDRVAAARATATLASVLMFGFRNAEAQALLEAALAEPGDLEGQPVMVALGGQLARAYFLQELHERAVEMADRILEVAEHADLVAVAADTLVTKGTALSSLSRPLEGVALMRAGGEIAEAHGLGGPQLRALGNLIDTQMRRDPRAAVDLARPALAVAARLGRRNVTLIYNSAYSGLRVGEWEWSLSLSEEALAELSDAGDVSQMLEVALMFASVRGEAIGQRRAEMERLVAGFVDPQIQLGLNNADAFIQFATGRYREAAGNWLRAVELARVNGGDMLPRAARAYLWAGDAAAAEQALAQLAAAGSHGPSIEADRMTMRAGLTALSGNRAEALRGYRSALRTWRELGLPWDEALCGIDMLLLLGADQPDAREAAAASREILERLGARPFVDVIDRELLRRSGAEASEARVEFESRVDAAAARP